MDDPKEYARQGGVTFGEKKVPEGGPMSSDEE
jgi:hypothetical protein